MELRHLRYFVAVAETGSIGAAAHRLHVAQPPLSTQLRELEEDLGVTLLTRGRQGTTLTAAGKVFLVEARRTLHAAGRALANTRAAAGLEAAAPTLRIGSLGTWHLRFLQPAFAVLRRNHPGLRLHFVNGPTSALGPALERGEIDAAIVHPPGEGEWHLRLLARIRVVSVLPATHPLAAGGKRRSAPLHLRELARESFVLPPRRAKSTLYDFIVEQCQTVGGFRPHVVREETRLDRIIHLVAAGEGVSLVPAHLCEAGLPGVSYRRLRAPVRALEVCLAWPRETANPLVEELVAAVQTPGSSPLPIQESVACTARRAANGSK